MEAGSDTTASILLSYMLGIISNPAAFAEAQSELDRLCGTGRSPVFDDLDNLPYLRACMTEVRHNCIRKVIVNWELFPLIIGLRH